MIGDKLNSALKSILSGKDTSLDLKNIKYLPRWVVYLIDISLVAVSTLLTILIVIDLTPSYYTLLSFYDKTFLILAVHIFYFYIFKTYAGIIRYSSNIDALKLQLATFSSFLTLTIINYIVYFVIDEKIFLIGGLFINLCISFSLLFLFRLGVKQIYEYFKLVSREEKVLRAVILGADENAISIAGALDIEIPRRFKIVGFLTNEKHNKSIRLLDKPVINYSSEIHKAVKSVDADAIVLSENNFTAGEKFNFVEDCLENNIQVFNAPIVSTWGEDQQPIANKVKSLQIEDLLEREPIRLNPENKEKQLTGKTILVTGGAGSIGSEIVRQVAKYKPKKLIILDQAETPLHSLSLEINAKFPNLNCKFIICDVGNHRRLELMFQNQDINVIYHAAAYKHVPLMEENPHEAAFVNIMGTKNLADLALKYQVSRFVMVSTDKAVNPTNVMGASKRAAEMYVQSLYHSKVQEDTNTTKFITTRFGNVLGSNGSVVPLFKKQIERGGPVTITHPDIIRYFMTIPEACQLVLEAGTMGNGGEIYIFDMGEPVKIMDLAIKMIKLAGYEPNKNIKIKITGLRPGEKLYEELLNEESRTLPTHHKKIMIGQEVVKDHEFVSERIEKIIKSANSLNADKMVRKLKILIPEFKSNNSSFESLDKKEKIASE
ncbi:NDP-sugar epimerase, includes UDP-GlcNAc-inverting 4,6-dehydratase FlaA1 and capsular polysaccharide biosynthesis protein EpsC [Salegentibacter echinorum]|uniref:NDP-sugar epimerase, includes UDP-GlcNAc-inverting 4,6-dehydratase FlaA1 and capsular polysaccharide biosynthesis protein EpsC n=1 Tax=Salegentibacter echinorum TaxID=1073325 RepID=A0A1M5FJT2_SALEC|nr:nucleoside-diphosphate sugar epimerase/dehydratase [Salegentibacter echinorum]SHF91738.1 NDP-sugar epimerase, includes UDP-GlcNAc-inverting 4,6-dehydratase FlaA1 and capsular polysaccharide biosynthesis protein EpsC [Salegentibacter echinorum]